MRHLGAICMGLASLSWLYLAQYEHFILGMWVTLIIVKINQMDEANAK